VSFPNVGGKSMREIRVLGFSRLSPLLFSKNRRGLSAASRPPRPSPRSAGEGSSVSLPSVDEKSMHEIRVLGLSRLSPLLFSRNRHGFAPHPRETRCVSLSLSRKGRGNATPRGEREAEHGFAPTQPSPQRGRGLEPCCTRSIRARRSCFANRPHASAISRRARRHIDLKVRRLRGVDRIPGV
jgi:hypothetical protein